jgi:hypothetical protein
MTFAKEIVGQWFGVAIPSWLRAFDCRGSGKDLMPRAPWGETLFGGEKASVDLGLRDGTWDGRHDTIPTSCSTYLDARTASESELARQVADMVKEATRLKTEYDTAKEAAKGVGGSCLYLPIAIEMSNYGWSVISDKRTCKIRAF